MTLHDGVDRFVSVQIQMLSVSQQPRFVHSHMDLAGSKAFGKGCKHMVDQLICTLIIGQQNVLTIHLNLSPAQKGIHMCQGLDTRDHRNAKACGKLIELLHLCLAVTTAHIAEKGLSVHLVGVLGIKHNTVIPHFFEQRQKALQPIHTHHRIA